jgi:GNAT superfamily N-acetyltransferase
MLRLVTLRRENEDVPIAARLQNYRDGTCQHRSSSGDDCGPSVVVEMARHACVIEDRPLPDADDDEVLEMLPPVGVVPIIAVVPRAEPLGAVWTYYGHPPLRRDTTGSPIPELCIAVVPGHRGAGIGGMLLDALFVDLAAEHAAMCTNVHIRNPAKRLYERKGFRSASQGNGPLGVALIKELR